MHALHTFVVYLHLISMAILVGGWVFFAAVVLPALRKSNVDGKNVLITIGQQFRKVAHHAFGLLFVTGLYLAYKRGVRFQSVADGEFHKSPFGQIFMMKMVLVIGVIVLMVLNAKFVKPKAIELLTKNPDSAEATALRNKAAKMRIINLVMALVVTFFGVMLTRGRIW